VTTTTSRRCAGSATPNMPTCATWLSGAASTRPSRRDRRSQREPAARPRAPRSARPRSRPSPSSSTTSARRRRRSRSISGCATRSPPATPEPAAVIARGHVQGFRAAWERSGLAYDRNVSELIDARAGEAASAASLSGGRCAVATQQTRRPDRPPGSR
jgi:hypothetical protein